MSAYIVSRDTIKAIILAYRQNVPTDRQLELTDLQISELLIDENLRSVYRINSQKHPREYGPITKEEIDRYQAPMPTFVGWSCLKNWQYQACDCDDHHTSGAGKLYAHLDIELLLAMSDSAKKEQDHDGWRVDPEQIKRALFRVMAAYLNMPKHDRSTTIEDALDHFLHCLPEDVQKGDLHEALNRSIPYGIIKPDMFDSTTLESIAYLKSVANESNDYYKHQWMFGSVSREIVTKQSQSCLNKFRGLECLGVKGGSIIPWGISSNALEYYERGYMPIDGLIETVVDNHKLAYCEQGGKEYTSLIQKIDIGPYTYLINQAGRDTADPGSLVVLETGPGSREDANRYFKVINHKPYRQFHDVGIETTEAIQERLNELSKNHAQMVYVTRPLKSSASTNLLNQIDASDTQLLYVRHIGNKKTYGWVTKDPDRFSDQDFIDRDFRPVRFLSESNARQTLNQADLPGGHYELYQGSGLVSIDLSAKNKEMETFKLWIKKQLAQKNEDSVHQSSERKDQLNKSLDDLKKEANSLGIPIRQDNKERLVNRLTVVKEMIDTLTRFDSRTKLMQALSNGDLGADQISQWANAALSKKQVTKEPIENLARLVDWMEHTSQLEKPAVESKVDLEKTENTNNQIDKDTKTFAQQISCSL